MSKGYTVDRSVAGTKIGEELMRSMHTLDAAVGDASEYELARVRPGTLLGCKCQDGECSTEKCDEVYGMTKDGQRFVTFHGTGLQGRHLEDGSISIYRVPTSARDRAIPRCRTLAGLNARNAEFWETRE
jgi:hypothetical protein